MVAYQVSAQITHSKTDVSREVLTFLKYKSTLEKQTGSHTDTHAYK